MASDIFKTVRALGTKQTTLLQKSRQSGIAERQFVEIKIKLNHATRKRVYIAH